MIGGMIPFGGESVMAQYNGFSRHAEESPSFFDAAPRHYM
jgi:hypothetical protein